MDEDDLLEEDVVKTYLYGLLAGMLMKHSAEVDDIEMAVELPVLQDNGIYADYAVVRVKETRYRIDITPIPDEEEACVTSS